MKKVSIYFIILSVFHTPYNFSHVTVLDLLAIYITGHYLNQITKNLCTKNSSKSKTIFSLKKSKLKKYLYLNLKKYLHEKKLKKIKKQDYLKLQEN